MEYQSIAGTTNRQSNVNAQSIAGKQHTALCHLPCATIAARCPAAARSWADFLPAACKIVATVYGKPHEKPFSNCPPPPPIENDIQIINDKMRCGGRAPYYKTIVCIIAAAMLAGSLSACKTMENLSEKEKVLVAAGAGILAAIVGKATQKSGEGAAAEAASRTQGSVLAAAKRKVAAGADAKVLRKELSNAINSCTFEGGLGEEECACIFNSYTHAAAEDRMETVRLLLDNGVGVNQKDDDGSLDEDDEGTPLYEALQLLAYAHNSCSDDNDGDTQKRLEMTQKGLSKMAAFLVSKGANVEGWIDSSAPWSSGSAAQYASPLGVALQYGSDDLVRILLENGANINTRSLGAPPDYIEKPLQTAARLGRAEFVKLLLEKGAKDKKAALKDAKYALMNAETEGQKAQYKKVISLLESAGGKKGTKKRK